MSNETDQNKQANEENTYEVDDATEGASRGPLVALGVIALVAVVGWLLFRELSASSRLQDCLLSGRTNCAPIERSTR
jgi:hypothetical protein